MVLGGRPPVHCIPGPGHHRTEARRGGAARERATVPHPGRGAAAYGLDCRAGRRARLLQRAQHRVHRPDPGAAPGLGVAGDHPPRRPVALPRAVVPIGRDRRTLRDRVPAAPIRRDLPLASRAGAAAARRLGPGQEVVRLLHRHRRPEARRGGGAASQGGGRGGQQGQERVPGQRQPRDPHPDERHPRHDRAGHRNRRAPTSRGNT